VIQRIASSGARHILSALMLAAILTGAYFTVVEARKDHAEAVELRRQWERENRRLGENPDAEEIEK
jgi:hypothetical protein